MTSKSSCHLLDMLAKLEDPRKDKGKRHPLKSILALMVSGAIISHLLSVVSHELRLPSRSKVLATKPTKYRSQQRYSKRLM